MHKPLARVAGSLLLLALLFPAPLWAKLPGILSMDVGWAGRYRAQRWNPVFITLQDPKAAQPYPGRLTVSVPHDASFRMVVSQTLTVTPQPATYLLYLPLPYSLDEVAAEVRDPAGTLIARVDFDITAANGVPAPSALSGDRSLLLGVSGAGPALRALEGKLDGLIAETRTPSFNSAEIAVAHLPWRDLPDIPQAYESLDLLVLNAPDLGRIPLKSQQAIAAWVEGGGRLLVWPGTAPMPPESPVARLLPCAIGDAQVVSLSLPDTQALHVAPRNERLPAWLLRPLPGAAQRPFLLNKASLFTIRRGFGTVGVLSVDPSPLVFDDQPAALALYRPLLRELLNIRADAPRMDANYGGMGVSVEERWRSAAVEQVVDRLGNVPGIGTFDFSYIAAVMVALMLIVGPIDYLVLKKLGRQPWTWATIAGWVGLVTFGGLYIGHVFRSGDLHYRTVQLIDQSEDQVVSSLTLAGIYSPKTRDYGLEGAPQDWWQPVAFEPSDYYYARRSSSGRLTDIGFDQDRQGQRLSGGVENPSMSIRVWDLRFLETRSADPGALKPLVRAQIHRDAQNRLFGTITNLGAAPLQNVCIRSGGRLAPVTASVQTAPAINAEPEQAATRSPPAGAADLPQAIAPGQSLSFRLELVQDDAAFRIGGSEQELNPWEVTQALRNSPLPHLQFIRSTCDLEAQRSARLDGLMAREDLACVYAESQVPAAPARLAAGDLAPRELHWQVVRALVRITPPAPETHP